MKTKISVFLICSGLILAAISCEKNETIVPSNNISSQFIDIKGYSGLEVDATFQAEVSFSDSEELIEIVANVNLHQYIIVEKVSDVLKIRLSDDVNISGSATLSVILTSGYLNSFSANGASEIVLKDTLVTDQVQLNIYGASRIEGPVSAQSVSANLYDASILDLEGKTTNYIVRASGASRANDYSFACDNLDCSLSDASEVKVTVHQKIDITASSASILYYKGEATINSQSLSGASSVVKTN